MRQTVWWLGDMSEALSFKVLHRTNEIMVSMSINKLKVNGADGTWQTIRIRSRPRYLNDLYSMNVLHDGTGYIEKFLLSIFLF